MLSPPHCHMLTPTGYPTVLSRTWYPSDVEHNIMPLYVYNFAIKTIEEITPFNMAASSVIFLLKISEHLVVSDHCESTASCELIKPLCEGFQHAKSFQLIGEVSALCRSELL